MCPTHSCNPPSDETSVSSCDVNNLLLLLLLFNCYQLLLRLQFQSRGLRRYNHFAAAAEIEPTLADSDVQAFRHKEAYLAGVVLDADASSRIIPAAVSTWS